MTRSFLIVKVAKRDGTIVPFDASKITTAIFCAVKACGGSNAKRAQFLTEEVMRLLEEIHDEQSIPTVERISDCVEKVLIENGHAKTAKAFILYRSSRTRIRRSNNTWIDVQKTIDEYLTKQDWRVRENSNTDYSFSGLMLHTAGKIIANYVLTNVYPDHVSQAHLDGYIHIHDLSNGVIGYCAGWSLKNLLLRGFGNVPNKSDSKPAKHLDVVVSQIINFLGVTQMEFAGAQAFSSVDTLLAPFVKTDNLPYREVKQNMQRLLFGLNIPSRWGSQTPFTNLTFDLVVPQDMRDEHAIVDGEEQAFMYGNCQKEMDMINTAFLELMYEGDASGRIFTFPIPTYNLTNDFNWESDVASLLFKVTAKYGTPYFQNYIGSNLDPKSIRAMCCRLNIDTTQLIKRPGSMWGPGDNTGSIGVVTININRIAYEAYSKDDFFSKLHSFMLVAKDSLEIKRKIINHNLSNGLMPYTKTYLGTFDNHFSTIGLCGMNEACLNFLGKDISTEEGRLFSINVLQFMSQTITEFQEETGYLYNLEATPAESTAFRFARLDRKLYPDIITAGTSTAPYLTNSTQLPVDATTDIWMALEHQTTIQHLYTGGTIFHTFLGERISDAEMCRSLVRKIAENTKLPYFSITPTFSICRRHGYLQGEKKICPSCSAPCEVYSRIVGYFRPVSNWNIGKKQEFKERTPYEYGHLTQRSTISGNKSYHSVSLVNDSPKVVTEIPNGSAIRYLLFTSPTCYRCPPFTRFIRKCVTLPGEEIDITTQEGKTLVNRYNVLSLPAILFLSEEEKVVFIANTIQEVQTHQSLFFSSSTPEAIKEVMGK